MAFLKTKFRLLSIRNGWIRNGFGYNSTCFLKYLTQEYCLYPPMNFRRKCFLLYEISRKLWLIMHCILDTFITPNVSVTSSGISTSKRIYLGTFRKLCLNTSADITSTPPASSVSPNLFFFPFLLLFYSSPKILTSSSHPLSLPVSSSHILSSLWWLVLH